MSAADKFWIKCLDVASWGRFFARQSDPRPSTPWLGRGSSLAAAPRTHPHTAPAGHSTSSHTGIITNPGFFSHPDLIHLAQSAPIPHCSVKVCRRCLGPFFGSCVQQVWAGRVAGPVWVCSLDVGFEPRQRSTTDWAPASLFASINKYRERPFSQTKTLYLISSYTCTLHMGTWQMYFNQMTPKSELAAVSVSVLPTMRWFCSWLKATPFSHWSCRPGLQSRLLYPGSDSR